MGEIVVLDEATVNKIAAGEVVERPASVVKELVENSLDAESTRIEIELADGGKTLIRVADNGVGMTADDAYLAVQPHATSKITSAEDLVGITTLGFRGEALPSIAAVSHFLLTTRRREQEAGTSVAIEGGKLLEVAEVGCPPGTQVTVRQLFYNVPARFKYLKSRATELARAVDVVCRLALAHPRVHFSLTHNGQQLLLAPPTEDWRARIADVLGAELAREMVEVHHETRFLRVFGHVGRPAVSRSDRSHIYLFANGRPVRNAMLSHAVERAYETLLPPGRHPVAVLFVQLEPRLVDPNVHPTKREVRFTREREVYAAVYAAVREALAAADVLTERSEGPEYILVPPRPREEARESPEEQLRAFHEALQERIAQSGARAAGERQAAEEPSTASPAQPAAERELVAQGQPIRIVGQVQNSYIVVEVGENLLIVDQHAAHERVLYEKNMRALSERPAESQGLLTPLTLELEPAEMAAVRESLDLLARLGFRVEPFGGNTLLVRGVPALRSAREAESILREVIAALAGGGEFGEIADRKQRLAASLACRAAIKAGEPLELGEMERLILELFSTEMRFTCPHSRPVFVTLTPEQLERQFRRR